jgi:hypothetical protein
MLDRIGDIGYVFLLSALHLLPINAREEAMAFHVFEGEP